MTLPSKRTIALATYLSTVLPDGSEDYGDYLANAIRKWPGLTPAEIEEAVDMAVYELRYRSNQYLLEAEDLRHYSRHAASQAERARAERERPMPPFSEFPS
jgi:hypothetical protein